MESLIKRFHEAKQTGAKQVIVWGSGRQRREFMFVDDMAEAALFLMENYHGNNFINIGTGVDVSIQELAGIIAEIVGYEGEIVMDPEKPDGMPQKLLDVSKLNKMGWSHKIGLREGIRLTYEDFIKNPDFATR